MYLEMDRQLAGLCPDCGDDLYIPGVRGCRCRDCDSCSSLWQAPTRAERNEGKIPRESCPDCKAEGY